MMRHVGSSPPVGFHASEGVTGRRASAAMNDCDLRLRLCRKIKRERQPIGVDIARQQRSWKNSIDTILVDALPPNTGE